MKKLTFRLLALVLCVASLFVGMNIGKNSVAFAAERDTESVTDQVAIEAPVDVAVPEETDPEPVVDEVEPTEATEPATEPVVEETEPEIEETEPVAEETEPRDEQDEEPVHEESHSCDHLWMYEYNPDGNGNEVPFRSCLKCGKIG